LNPYGIGQRWAPCKHGLASRRNPVTFGTSPGPSHRGHDENPAAEADRGRRPGFARYECLAGGPGSLAERYAASCFLVLSPRHARRRLPLLRDVDPPAQAGWPLPGLRTAQAGTPLLRLPDDLRAFLAAGRQLQHDPSDCEAGKVILVPLERLRVGKF